MVIDDEGPFVKERGQNGMKGCIVVDLGLLEVKDIVCLSLQGDRMVVKADPGPETRKLEVRREMAQVGGSSYW